MKAQIETATKELTKVEEFCETCAEDIQMLLVEPWFTKLLLVVFCCSLIAAFIMVDSIMNSIPPPPQYTIKP